MRISDWGSDVCSSDLVEELAQIKDAVDANYAQPLHHRRLRHIVELFRGGHRPRADDLWSRLRPWWGDGARAWLFDNAVDATDLSARSVGFDMTQILHDPAVRTPAIIYLFHRVEVRLDGRTALIVVDAVWRDVDDDVSV